MRITLTVFAILSKPSIFRYTQDPNSVCLNCYTVFYYYDKIPKVKRKDSF